MFSNLTLYYLNQLGIVPWINKESSLKLPDKSSTVESNLLKLVVLVSSDLSNKAQALFNRMMASINVEKDELLIIKILTQDLADNKKWLTQIEKNTPRAVFALGLNVNDDLFADLNSSYPIVQSFAPEYLLDNPSYKKKVFHDLNTLKGLLS
ncbi:DNA polymerase III subunit psi [Legionella maioricensis]|uniref:DNA polymerase III subunit psi n=1 Tax=Legionella maioricensis TaxID=2896528 RepID=A0A9X2D0C4_9GAMM|nr:DNA polymerase III subunit psi [Legionella maioricensis]MCL9684250.1 DNA polymerase III subunit psi [Legionella maioricensis]MCL9687116.1 DNA polymerase III subunit psi [Legionella maioricensis]